MKKLHILLLFIAFINNLTSMQIQGEKEITILDLPNEMLDNIVKQVMEPDFLKMLNNWRNVFEEAPKPDLNLIKSLGQTCKKFHCLYKYNLRLAEKLKLFNNLKKRKFKQLFIDLKNKSLKKYKGILQEELDAKLIEILSNGLINKGSIYANFRKRLKDAVKLILAGANINAKDNKVGMTTLIWAVNLTQKEIVEILVNANADVNIKNDHSWTALIYAACNGYKEVAEIIINSKADVNIKDNNKKTALMLAACNGYKEIIEALINAGADIDAKDNRGLTSLIKATRFNYKDIVEVLIAAGADVNAKDNDFGRTALIFAVQRDYKDLVEILINAGASIDSQTLNGDTALMWAVDSGYKDLVEILINAGADINIQNNKGWTTLMTAVIRGYLGVAMIIIKERISQKYLISKIMIMYYYYHYFTNC